MPDLCACGCGTPLPPARRNGGQPKLYATNACRVRASAQRRLRHQIADLAAQIKPEPEKPQPMQAVGVWLPVELVRFLDNRHAGSRSRLVRHLLAVGRAVVEGRSR
jgi:hypothetical protein